MSGQKKKTKKSEAGNGGKRKTKSESNKNKASSDGKKGSKKKSAAKKSKGKVDPKSKTNNDIFSSSKGPRKRPSMMQRVKSSLNLGVEEIDLGDRAAQAVELLQIDKYEINTLKRLFDEYDTDGSGEIDYDEMLDIVNEERTKLTDALFLLIDVDGSGKISFDEFILVLSTYCIYGKDDILRFCFDTYDVDGSGAIDEKEFMDMCVDINKGAPIFPGNFTRALEQFDKNGDGLIDFGEFRELNKRYPMVNYAAFRLQDKLQKASLGENKWRDILKHKAKREYIEEYKRKHNGALPPEPLCTRIKGRIFGSRTKAKYDLED